jgi:hypothetical protein
MTFKAFVQSEGHKDEGGFVSFPTEKAATVFADRATRRGFQVAITKTNVAGIETWHVTRTGP